MTRILIALVALTSAVLCAPAGGSAQGAFPSRPIEFVVPWGPGGGADQVTRKLSQLLEPALKVSLPVVNIAGATGVTGLALAGIAVMVGFVALIGQIGFLLSCFATLFGVMMVGGFQRPAAALMIAAFGAFGFFVVFQKIAYVSLPLGAGPFGSFSHFMLNLIGVR